MVDLELFSCKWSAYGQVTDIYFHSFIIKYILVAPSNLAYSFLMSPVESKVRYVEVIVILLNRGRGIYGL